MIDMRSSAKNICSVRQKPMPSAPNPRAIFAWSGTSALARPLCPKSSAHVSNQRNRGTSPTSPHQLALNDLNDFGFDHGNVPLIHVAGRPVDRQIIAFSELFRADLYGLAVSTSTASQPATQLCPSAVRPQPHAMSCRLARSRIPPRHSSHEYRPGLFPAGPTPRGPRAFISTARSGVSAIFPAAAPGPAGSPLPSGFAFASSLVSKIG